ncbi:MAG: HAD family hydrolase [Chloroflexi bacterium]|nr:HAD family hydrolase [Chloroflexota bacterium]
MKRPAAVLFDVYDTLFLNDRAAWLATFDQICREQKLPVAGPDLWGRWKRHEVKFRATRTNLDDPGKSPPFKSYEQAWKECFELAFLEADMKGDAVRAARLSVENMSRRAIFPDTRPAIESLRRAVRVGIFSNADDAFLLPLLKRSNLKFEAVVSSESARIYKPSQGAFRHILDLMRLRPEQAWYVGDQLFDDVLGAKSVGMTAIWINRNGSAASNEGSRPDATISDLRQLPELVESSGAV